VSWPAVIKKPRVMDDLISSTDFLPTICEAAGVKVPKNVDGVSFLPQLQGKAGTPRDWLYTWYSPRQRQDLTVKEYAFDTRYKLYRTGEFYDLSKDEKNDLAAASLDNEASAAKKKLQAVLDRFTDARPVALDKQFVESGVGKEKTEKKAKKQGKKKGKKAE